MVMVRVHGAAARLSITDELADVAKLLRRLEDPAHAALEAEWKPRLETASSATAEKVTAAAERQRDLVLERETVRGLKERSNAVARGLYGRLIHRFQDDPGRAELYFPSVRKEAGEDGDGDVQPTEPPAPTPGPAPAPSV